MNLSRHLIRTAFFNRLKKERKNYKQLKKWASFDSFSSFLKNVVLGVTGLSVLSAPAWGSEITAHGTHTKITKTVNGTNNTFTITTDQIKDKNAFNAFKKFTLSSNDIANLHLPDGTSNLLNFVYSKIDVEGTVNAIKNNKTGGNLFFLSSQGLILGKSGVINAGAFYAMTPDKSFMDKFKASDGVYTNFSQDIDFIVDRKIVNRNLVNTVNGVILSPDGEIIIEGKINTFNGIGLYSGGQLKDSNNKLTGGVKIKSGAELNTLSISDFSSIVNTQGLVAPDEVEFVSKAGDIEIASVGDNTHSANFILGYITGYNDVFTSENRKNANGLAEVSIEKDSKITSRGNVNVDAITTNGQLYRVYSEDRYHNYRTFSTFTNLESKISIDGSIKAGRNINVNAQADSNMVTSGVNALSMALELMGATTPFNFDAHPVLIDVHSKVNIKEHAVLEANKQVDIKADSFNNVEDGASTSSWILNAKLNNAEPFVPSAGVVYVNSKVSAKVDVAGSIKSKDEGLSVKAFSENRLSANATAANTQKANPAFALSIVEGENTALVNTLEGASFDAKKTIEIISDAENRPNVSANGEVGNDSYGAGALALLDFVSSSTVNINSDIKPENLIGSLTINAINDSWENTCQSSVSCGIGSGTKFIDNLKTNIIGSLYNTIAPKFMPVLEALPANSSKKFNIGGAVAVDLGKYDSKVTIGKGKKIVTKGDLIVKAQTIIEDVDIKASSSGESGCDDESGKKSGFNMGFVWADIKHNADVIIADSTETNRTELTGKNVQIKSTIELPYSRVNRLIENVLWAVTVLKARCSDDDAKEKWNRVENSFKKISADFEALGESKFFSSNGISNLIDGLKDCGIALSSAVTTIVSYTEIVSAALDILKSAVDFVSPSNYFNIGASSSGSYESGKDDDKLKNLSFSGSVGLTWVDNKSHVLVGKNTSINSSNPQTASTSINIYSGNNLYLFTTAGSPELISLNGGSCTIGGSFAFQNLNSVAETVISDGTALIARNGDKKSNISVSSTNEVDELVVAFTGSKGSSGFDGMLTYSYGDLHANTLVDNSVNIIANKFSMNAYNYDNVANIAGALMISDNSGVGIGAAITDYDKETQVRFEDNNAKSNSLAMEFGVATETARDSLATQTVNVFEGASKTSGTFNTIGIAASVAMYSDSGEQGKIAKFFGKISDFTDKVSNWAYEKASSLSNKAFNLVFGHDIQNLSENRKIPEGNNDESSGNRPSFSLDLSGSTGINFIDNTTSVVFDKANIVAEGADSRVSATAINTAHTLSFAGAAGINLSETGKQENQNKTTVGVNGTIALNTVDSITEAVIKNSKIKEADKIENTSVSGGDTSASALGLGLNVGSGSEKKTHGVAVDFNVNLINETINSELQNNIVTGSIEHATNIFNTAYNSALNITCGVGLNAGKQKSATSGSVNIQAITSNLSAKILGGTYTNVKDILNQALMAVKQINTAISVAAAVGADNGTYAFNGALAYSEIDNTSDSIIASETRITAVDGGKVSVISSDVRSGSDYAKQFQDLLDRDSDEIKDLDIYGSSFYKGLEPASGTESIEAVAKDSKGSLIVTVSATGTGGDVAAGAAFSVNKINNRLNSKINDAKINADTLSVGSKDNVLMITISGGVSGSSNQDKGAGAGSFTWSDINNTANTEIANSTLTLNNLDAFSNNAGYITSVSGQIAGAAGKGAAGASITFNGITNTANTLVHGGIIDGKSNSNSQANVNAENKGNIVGVGVSVDASKEIAVGGTLVINEIDNNSTAIIGSSTTAVTNLKNIGKLAVKATDTAKLYSLSGIVTGSTKSSGGGAVAVNTIIGTTSAQLLYSSLDSVKKADVRAVNDSKIMTMAAGFSGSGKCAFDGASTVGDIFRDVKAVVASSTSSDYSTDLRVDAYSKGLVDALATVVAGSGKYAGGAGVSVSRIGGETSALANSNKLKLDNFILKADSDQSINTIGIAGAGAGTAGLSGSFAYNSQNNDVIAKIDGGSIEANKNVGVIAQSDEEIGNYAGVGGFGGEAGVGVSLGINYINGKTQALVENASVSSNNTGTSNNLVVNNVISKNSIYSDLVSTSTIDLYFNLRNQRSGVEKKGIVVDSSSSRTMKAFTASLAGGGTAGVNANVTVNYIGGSTEASIAKSTVNDSGSGSNVSVNASDYTDSANFIGSVSVGGEAGLGASSVTNKVKRDTTAKISELKKKGKADTLEVKAVSMQGLSSVVAGIAVGGSAGVAGNVSVALLEGTTKAEIYKSDFTAKALDVNADHFARTSVLSGSAGFAGMVGVGAAINVTNDRDTVLARVASSTIDTTSGSGDFSVNANNDSKINAYCAAFGVGPAAAGVAGAVSVNYMEQHVDADVADSKIGSSDRKTGKITVSAKDKSELNNYGGSLGGGLYAGVGVAVNVNTIDSHAKTNISNSKLYSSKKAEITTHQETNGQQGIGCMGLGAGGVGINVAVVKIGDKYSSTIDGQKVDSVDEATKKASYVLSDDQFHGNDFGYLSDADKNNLKNSDVNLYSVESGKASTETNIKSSEIKSDSIDVNSDSTGKIELITATVAGGFGGLTSSWGFVKNNQSVVTTVDNSNLVSDGLMEVEASTGGNSGIFMAQGASGLAGLAGGFSYLDMTGLTGVTVNNSTLKTSGNLNIKSEDNSRATLEAFGCSAGIGAFGIVVAKAENESTSQTWINSSQLDSNNTNITAEKDNYVNTWLMGGTVGGVDVGVLYGRATDVGTTTVKLTGLSNITAKSEANVKALNKQKLVAELKQLHAGILPIGVGDINAIAEGTANISVEKGNLFNAKVVNINGTSDTHLVSNSWGHNYGLIGVDVNVADATAESTVTVDVEADKNTFAKAGTVIIAGNSNNFADLEANGLAVAGVSIINNRASATANLNTNVSLKGSSSDYSLFDKVQVSAVASATHKLYANGDGGGVISASPYSAQTNDVMIFNTNTTIAGNLQASEFSASTGSIATSKTTADSTQGSAFGGLGTEGITTIKNNSTTTVAKNSKIKADNIYLNATNEFVTGDSRVGLNARGRMSGGIVGSGNDSIQEITGNTKVIVDEKALLQASKSLKIDTKTLLNLKNYIYSNGAGIGIHPYGTSDSKQTLNNIVSIAKGASLATTGESADVFIGNYNNYKYDLSAIAEVLGSLEGSASSNTLQELNNTNKIDINGEIKSLHDINLYTDRDANGNMSTWKADIVSQALNKAGIPVYTNANLKNKINRNNNINVNSTGSVESVRHTSLVSANCYESITETAKEYNWAKGEVGEPSVTTTGAGKISSIGTSNNGIKVDGKVVAGINNKIDFTINGKVILAEGASSDGSVRKPEIISNNEDYKNAVQVKTIEYANRLYDRYLELTTLLSEYEDSNAAIGYQAELQRVMAEMEKYGLLNEKDGYSAPVAKLYVDAIELPDMYSSGGNIYINTDAGNKVTGSGLIYAKGAPEINITNNSNLYMIVNDLKIEDPGGQILLNDVSLGKNAQTTLGVAQAKTDEAGDSKIDVKENWKSVYDVTYTTEEGKTEVQTSYSPLTNLEINGQIHNPLGSVSFYNAKKDIIIQGKSAKESASINGAVVTLKAEGSISQGYSKGITNIGYTPEDVYASFTKSKENEVSSSSSNPAYGNGNLDFSKQSSPENGGGTWIAGGMVFLNADDINVNGIIQSGYSNFEVNLTESKYNNRIAEIAQTYKNNNSPTVNQSYLSQYCKLNEGGMKWDSVSGTYRYEVQAYYNPELDRIELDDITSEGGKIYLTGRISSTGNGKILAADGATDIKIVNETNKSLIASELNTGDRKGLISIMDLAKTQNGTLLGTMTEITSDDTKIWYVKKNSKEGINQDAPDAISSKLDEYKPLDNLTYNWTTGYNSTVKYTYDTSEDWTLWGLIDYNEVKREMQSKSESEMSKEVLSNDPKMKGNYIGNQVAGIDHSKGYNISLQVFNDFTSEYFNSRTEYDNWTHFSGTDYFTYSKTTGSKKIFEHSIKADNPIKIGFLAGSGNVDVKTKNNLVLGGSVYSKSGSVNLISETGSIAQTSGSINAMNVTMKADKGIGDSTSVIQHIMSGSSGILSAVTNTGDVAMKSSNIAGLIDNSLKITATTEKGNVSLSADASLLSGGTGKDVKGSRIDLSSNNGSIGALNNALKIIAGQETTDKGDSLSASVNAISAKDVALEQTVGDMRIGKIVSKGGDVYLKSSGGIIDALPPKAEETRSASSDKLIQQWTDAGIINADGSENAESRRQEALESYEKSNKASFDRYMTLKKHYEGASSEVQSEEYAKLKEKFGDYSTFDSWFSAEKANKDSHYNSIKNLDNFGWIRDELLYAVQNSIINKEGGSTRPERDANDANVKGRNITLIAGSGIGRDEGSKVVDISNLQSAEGIEALKEISSAEADDISWGYNGSVKDANKATINKINGIFIDATGNLKAEANGNIYLEDVAGNALNVTTLKSNKGNIRLYGKNGVYNLGNYTEGASGNSVNFFGKNLILEGGKESIGTSAKPVTTNMSGAITARSDKFINMYQIGLNNMTIAAISAGGTTNLRAVNSILSVYNGVEADELGYINSFGDITLLSDNGDIGEGNDKGLRIHHNKDMVINAEANSIYIKGAGTNVLGLGSINSRNGDLSIDSGSSKADIVLTEDMSAKSIEFIANSVSQLGGTIFASGLLNVLTQNGMSFESEGNKISSAKLYNTNSGGIYLENTVDLTLNGIRNDSDLGTTVILNDGKLTSESEITSKDKAVIWAGKDIALNKDVNTQSGFMLYSEDGSIKAESVTSSELSMYAGKGSITAKSLSVKDSASVNSVKGNISIYNVDAENGVAHIVAEDGNINLKTISGKEGVLLKTCSDNGDITATSIESGKKVEAYTEGNFSSDTIKAGKAISIEAADVTIDSASVAVSASVDEKSELFAFGRMNMNSFVSDGSAEIFALNGLNATNVATKGDLSLVSVNRMFVNSISSEGAVSATSIMGGLTNKTITSGKGTSISSVLGDISIDRIEASDDIYIDNTEGNVDISEKLVTKGNLHITTEKGNISFPEANVSGDSTIYNQKGNITAERVVAGNGFEAIGKEGNIRITFLKTGTGDALVSAEKGKVTVSKVDSGKDVKISGKTGAYVSDIVASGSMLLTSEDGGCEAKTLNVAGDLKLITNSGYITVENASVGNDSFISIDKANGGDILIKGIETGKDLKGSLFIESASTAPDAKIDIYYAKSAFNMVINSLSKVSLTSAYALNGFMEVIAKGDVVSNVMEAATYAFVSAVNGNIKINSILSGNNIMVVGYNDDGIARDVVVDNAMTLNSENGDILVLNSNGNLSVSNATASQDLFVINENGDLRITGSSAGKQAHIVGEKSTISVSDFTAGALVLDSVDGKIKADSIKVNGTAEITNSGGVADLNKIIADVFTFTNNGGISNIADVKATDRVQINSDIKGDSDSSVKLLSLETNEFKLVNKLNSGVISISELTANTADLSNNGSLSLSDSAVAGKMTVGNSYKFTLDKSDIGGLNLRNEKSASSELTYSKFNGIDLINDGILTAKGIESDFANIRNNSDLAVAYSNFGKAEFNNSRNFELLDVTSKDMLLHNEGTFNAKSLSSEKLDLSNSGTFNVDDLSSEIINLSNSGTFKVRNGLYGDMKFDNSGTVGMKEVAGNSLVFSNSGNIDLTNFAVNSLEAVNNKNLTLDNTALNTTISEFKLMNSENGIANLTGINSGNMTLTNHGKFVMSDSAVNSMGSANKGSIQIDDSVLNKLELTNGGTFNADDLSSEIINLSNSGTFKVLNGLYDDMKIQNSGSVVMKEVAGKSLAFSNLGNIDLTNFAVNSLEAVNNKNITLDNTALDTTISEFKLINSENGIANLSSINSGNMTLTNHGKFVMSDSVQDKLELNNSGSVTKSNVETSSMNILSNSGSITSDNSIYSKIVAENTGNIKLRTANIGDFKLASKAGSVEANDSVFKTLVVSENKGSLKIGNSSVESANIQSSGKFDLSNSNSKVFRLSSSGAANINNSSFGSASFSNSGNSYIDEVVIDKTAVIKNNAGDITIDALEIKADAWIDNKADMSIEKLDVNGNLNLGFDSGASINYENINIQKDLDMYASEGTFSGNNLTIGNNLYILNYKDYVSPDVNSLIRASFTSKTSNLNSKANTASAPFKIIQNKLTMGGDFLVDKDNISIDVKEATIGKDVYIKGDTVNAVFEKFNAGHGAVDVIANFGNFSFGEVTASQHFNSELGSGDTSAKNITTDGALTVKAGGNVSIEQSAISDTGNVSLTAGANIAVGESAKSASGNVSLTAGANIDVGESAETVRGSVNLIAGGNVNAYKVLAKQQGNIEAYNGDIVIGQINGKTLVFRQGTNERSLRVDEVNVEKSIDIGADYVDIKKINHSGTDDTLKINFNLVNGNAMKNVVIGNANDHTANTMGVNTNTGVDMYSLISGYANVQVNHENFNLTKTYIMRQGDLKNNNIHLRLFGDQPFYDKLPHIIGYFTPGVRGKMFADVSFINRGDKQYQDYIPLISKSDYQRMFNEYTLVQKVETWSKGNEKVARVIADEYYNDLYLRSLMDKVNWYNQHPYGIDGYREIMNPDGVAVPLDLGLDYDGYELTKKD